VEQPNPHPSFERLSPLDASMLAIEDHAVHMHMGGVTVFDAGPLWRPDTGLDIARVRDYVASRLHHIPRYRQRLAFTPVERYPVWVDDPHFNLHYHVRHTSLPKAAGVRELKRLAGRILSQRLDRGKPLWEMWFVEGCGEGRFALITKIHHCMVDGMGGVELLRHLMSPEPTAELEPRAPWIAQPAPRPARLLADSLLHPSATLLRDAWDTLSAPREALQTLRAVGGGVLDAVRANLRAAPETPLNHPIGPHRRLDWLCMDLDAVKQVGREFGATVNDVVLAVTAGALRRFLSARRDWTPAADFLAMVPVDLRSDSAAGRAMGNQVSMLVAPLPVDVADPVARLERVVEATGALKSSRTSHATRALEKLFDWTLPGAYGALLSRGARTRTHNVLVTNVRGPREPVYLLGARQLDVYPAVPLFANQSLAIGIFSYENRLYWGFNSDWDMMPDLHDLVEDVEAELDALLRRSAPAQPIEPPPAVAASSAGPT